MKIRELRKGEEDLLKDFLYEAIFIPEGVEPPAREIIALPELRLYYEDFGSGEADYCLVATVNENATGNDQPTHEDIAENERHPSPFRSTRSIAA